MDLTYEKPSHSETAARLTDTALGMRVHNWIDARRPVRALPPNDPESRRRTTHACGPMRGKMKIKILAGRKDDREHALEESYSREPVHRKNVTRLSKWYVKTKDLSIIRE